MEQTFGSVIAFEECIEDMEKLIQTEYLPSHEAFMEDLIEKALETTTNIISWVIREEYTIKSQEVEFLFWVTKEDGIVLVVYIGYQEGKNQLVG